MRDYPMEAKKVKQCGARTRAGTPCKRRPTFQGRCNLHGGKSCVGIGHPNYKHGWYSKYMSRYALVDLLNLQGYYRDSWGDYLKLLKELNQKRQPPDEKSGDRVEV